MAIMRKIAEEAGVSLSTVSFVLNGKADKMRISPATQNKILAIAKERNYIPNVTAKKLTYYGSRSVPEIALLWSPAQHFTFLSTFIDVAETTIALKSARAMRFVIDPFRIGEMKKIGKTLTSGQYNGIIAPPTATEDIEYINSLKLNIPVVLLHGMTKTYSSVQIDNYKAGKEAAKVFALNGHKNVAIISHRYKRDVINISRREEGFEAICKKNNMRFTKLIADLDLTATVDRFSYNFEVGNLLAKKLLSDKDLPTAVFVMNDLAAFGLTNALADAGVRIPQDIEIIAFGSNYFAEIAHPPITTVNFPTEEICREAVLMMSGLLGNPDCPKVHKTVKSPIIFRESCRRPAGYIDKSSK